MDTLSDASGTTASGRAGGWVAGRARASGRRSNAGAAAPPAGPPPTAAAVADELLALRDEATAAKRRAIAAEDRARQCELGLGRTGRSPPRLPRRCLQPCMLSRQFPPIPAAPLSRRLAAQLMRTEEAAKRVLTRTDPSARRVRRLRHGSLCSLAC